MNYDLAKSIHSFVKNNQFCNLEQIHKNEDDATMQAVIGTCLSMVKSGLLFMDKIDGLRCYSAREDFISKSDNDVINDIMKCVDDIGNDWFMISEVKKRMVINRTKLDDLMFIMSKQGMLDRASIKGRTHYRKKTVLCIDLLIKHGFNLSKHMNACH